MTPNNLRQMMVPFVNQQAYQRPDNMDAKLLRVSAVHSIFYTPVHVPL